MFKYRKGEKERERGEREGESEGGRKENTCPIIKVSIELTPILPEPDIRLPHFSLIITEALRGKRKEQIIGQWTNCFAFHKGQKLFLHCWV